MALIVRKPGMELSQSSRNPRSKMKVRSLSSSYRISQLMPEAFTKDKEEQIASCYQPRLNLDNPNLTARVRAAYEEKIAALYVFVLRLKDATESPR